MKTTLEIPDTLFRRAKSKAAERGIPLRQFVTEAVEDKLKTASAAGQRPWMKHIGKLKDLRKETAMVNRVIEEAFEEVDPQAVRHKYGSSPTGRRQSMQALVGLWKNRKKSLDSETYVRRLRKGKRLRRLASQRPS